MIRLQNILLPKQDVCDKTEMYYRAERSVLSDAEDSLLLKPGEPVLFDTYFNSFTAEKWQKYTRVQAVKLVLHLKGKIEVTLLNRKFADDRIASETLAVETVSARTAEDTVLSFPERPYQGMLCFALTALEEGACITGGWYGADLEETELNDVNLAVNICTFKREAYIEHNLKLLHERFLDDPNSELYGHLHVFISDNGKTLDIPSLSGDSVHIVKNRNVGGAGGFTRNMIEIMHCDSYRASHALLMDDDIVIEPEAIFRTYTLLRCRKEEYRDAFIGGAMLRLDRRNIQVESGAVWNAGDMISLKENLDLTDAENVLRNEAEEYTEYNAWWFCCIPMAVIRPDNLPLPIFFRGDDLEYGLRNIRQLILLNGICVWHEPFENKYSSATNYYILRNMYYDNALHFPDFGTMDAVKKMWRFSGREILYYRYKNVDLILMGVKDFLKGAAFLMEADAEKLHRDLIAYGYRAVPVEELDMDFSEDLYEESQKQAKRGKTFRDYKKELMKLNGLLFPANRDNIVSMSECKPPNFYRAKRVLHYDRFTNRGFMTEKSLLKTVQYTFILLGMSVRMAVQYPGARKDFLDHVPELTGEPFWRKYLGLQDNVKD